jgi:hypothetical protein
MQTFMDRLKATNPFALEAEGLCRGGSLGLYMVSIHPRGSIVRPLSFIIRLNSSKVLINLRALYISTDLENSEHLLNLKLHADSVIKIPHELN